MSTLMSGGCVARSRPDDTCNAPSSTSTRLRTTRACACSMRVVQTVRMSSSIDTGLGAVHLVSRAPLSVLADLRSISIINTQLADLSPLGLCPMLTRLHRVRSWHPLVHSYAAEV